MNKNSKDTTTVQVIFQNETVRMIDELQALLPTKEHCHRTDVLASAVRIALRVLKEKRVENWGIENVF